MPLGSCGCSFPATLCTGICHQVLHEHPSARCACFCRTVSACRLWPALPCANAASCEQSSCPHAVHNGAVRYRAGTLNFHASHQGCLCWQIGSCPSCSVPVYANPNTFALLVHIGFHMNVPHLLYHLIICHSTMQWRGHSWHACCCAEPFLGGRRHAPCQESRGFWFLLHKRYCARHFGAIEGAPEVGTSFGTSTCANASLDKWQV